MAVLMKLSILEIIPFFPYFPYSLFEKRDEKINTNVIAVH